MIQRILFAAALLPSIFLLTQSLDVPMMGLFGDDTIYYSSAQSIALGNGYRLPSLEGKPHQTKYPPLFPLLLSIAWKINPDFPANLPVAACIAWSAVPFYLFLAWRVFLGFQLSPGLAIALVLILAFNGQVLLFGSMLMSEIWFSSAILATMAFLFRAERPAAGGVADRYAPIFAGVCAGLAYLIKSSALPLLVTLPMGFLLRRQPRRAWQAALPMLLAVLAWNLWARLNAVQSTDISVQYNTSYLGYYLRDLTLPVFASMAATNFRLLYSGLPRTLVLDPSGSAFENVLTIFVLVCGVMGCIRLIRRSGHVQYPLFALGYIVQLVAWNFMPTARLLLPVLPLFLAGIATWVADAFRVLQSDEPMLRPRSILSLATMALMGPLTLFLALVSFGVTFVNLPAAIRENRVATEGKRAAYAWILQNTPKEAGVLANDDQLLYLFTGRRSASQIVPALLYYTDQSGALRAELQKLPDYAREHRLDYVLVTSTDLRRENLERYRQDLDQIMRSAVGYRKVFDTPLAQIYSATNSPMQSRN